MSSARFYLLFCVFVLTSVEAQTRLNIFVADPRGGRGDIAANFLMAKRLLEMRPDSDIRVLVPRQSLDIAQFLEPDMARGTSSMGPGIKIIQYGPGIPVPKADAVLSYSTSGDPIIGVVADSAPRILMFLEPDYEQKSLIYQSTWDPSEEPSAMKTILLNTGTGNLGNYVSPQGSTRQNFASLRERLAQETGISVERIPNLENGFLAMGYSSNSEVTRAYIDYSIYLARKAVSRTGDQPILFVVNRKGWADVDHKIGPIANEPNQIFRLGTDVFVLPYERLSLGLSEALYGASDLPPLATGDASKAMAIQHGRSFLYELQGWKLGSYVDFVTGLSLSPTLNWLQNESLSFRVLENSNYQSARRGKKHSGLSVSVDAVTLAKPAENWRALDHAVTAVREHGSLADNTWLLLDHMKKSPIPLTYAHHKRFVRALDAFAGLNCSSALSRLRQHSGKRPGE